jgi:hypothetical protein
MGEGEFCPDTTGESRQKDNNHAGKKTVKLLRVIRDITTSWGENTGYLTITLKKGNTSKKRLSENKNI